MHAFASDPERGLFILLLLGAITGGSLTLYAFRARYLTVEGGFRLVSRESFLLMNNILLVVATAAVLFGTLYPLFLDALGMGKISLGPPYFNAVFLVPMLPLAVLVGMGMHTTWLRMSGEPLRKRLLFPAGIALMIGIIFPFILFGQASALTLIGVVTALWVIASSLLEPAKRLFQKNRSPMPLTRGQWGMYLAHMGVGVFILGATVTSSYNIETDSRAVPGDRWQVGEYELYFRDIRRIEGVNYEATEGEFEVWEGDQLVTILRPQKRVYRVQTSPMTEAAIDVGWGRDLFIALGDPLGDGAWSLRVQIKPLIRFIWLGALIMAFGGLLAIMDPRYRVKRTQEKDAISKQSLETA